MKLTLKSFKDIPYELQMETRYWRNSKNVTKYFRIPYISEDCHKKWLESLNKSKPQNIAFIIMNDNEPIGVAYFHSIDYIKKKADWGMYIYKENFRGKGVGFFVLTECIDFAKNNLKLFTLYLDVLKSNIAAIKLYQKCGFKEMWADDLFYRYFLQLNEE